MNLHNISVAVTLTEINCGECGGTYAINERYREQQYQQGGSWTCPYCECGWGYSENNENSKLKKQLEAEKRGWELAEHQAERAREHERHAKNVARAQKAAKTRIKNRIKNGVCPCCNRTFQNLHKQHQHPEYAK